MKKLLVATFAALFALAFSQAYATSAVKAQTGQVAADDESKSDEAKSPADSDKKDEQKDEEGKKDDESKKD
jgi:uncharacterized low-complexity protein